ncbi:MAG: glycosyltransferase [Sphingomicrobium sp.]
MTASPVRVLRRIRSFLGSAVRELGVHLEAIRIDRLRPTVLILPSQGREDGAANLRGYLVATRLRTRGWNAFTCPKHLRLGQRSRIIRHLKPDVLLMQTARHPLNRPDLYPSIPVVFDLDDADYLDKRVGPAVDHALQGSRAVIAGSRSVADYCRRHNDDVTVVWTGSPVSDEPFKPQRDRRPIVAWAASCPVGSPHEAAFLAEVISALSKRGQDFEFWIYADDGTDAYKRLVRRFEEAGARVRAHKFLSYADYLASLNEAAVGLAPLVDVAGFSGGKSFGKVLAYLDRGVPVVTHPVVDHPHFFRNGATGFMAETPGDWADHIARLLGDAGERQRVAEAAHLDFERRLTVDESAARVDAVLRRITGTPDRRSDAPTLGESP